MKRAARIAPACPNVMAPARMSCKMVGPSRRCSTIPKRPSTVTWSNTSGAGRPATKAPRGTPRAPRGSGPGCRGRPGEGAGEARRQVAARSGDLGADEAGAEHRHADATGRQLEPQALRQRDDAVLGYVVGDAVAGDQASDRGGRDDVPALAMPLDQRSEDLDAPDHRHQIDAERPVPAGVGPGPVRPAAADAGIVDQD